MGLGIIRVLFDPLLGHANDVLAFVCLRQVWNGAVEQAGRNVKVFASLSHKSPGIGVSLLSSHEIDETIGQKDAATAKSPRAFVCVGCDVEPIRSVGNL